MPHASTGNRELLIERAYADLQRLPKTAGRPRMLPLAQVGNSKILMVESPRLGPGDTSLFWIERFDREEMISEDGCSCSGFAEAVAAVDAFMAAAV